MIRVGPGCPQDPRAAPGIAEASPHRLGKISLGDIVRTAGKEQQASGGGYRGGEAGELAIAAQRRRQILARLGEGGRVGDDDVEALTGSG